MRHPRSRLPCLCLALVALTAVPARGEEPADASQPTTDVRDLWRLVRHRDVDQGPATPQSGKAVVLSPSIGSKPSTGLSGGFTGNTAFFLGDPRTTHPSSFPGGFRFSQKKQTLGNVKFSTFTPGDRWFVQGDARLSWTSEDTYGLGPRTQQASAENVKYDYRRLYGTVYRHVRPGVFVGFGLNVSDHANVRPDTALATRDQSAYATYSTTHGFAGDGQRSGGTAAALLFDTRDNGINAQRGSLASAAYRTFFEGFLGGDSAWQELLVDARTYRKITKDGSQKLAFWFLGDFVTGGTAPYFDLPTTGGSERSARGYSEGRYRGEHLVYGEVEYRGTLTRSGLLGFVAFLNTTTLDSLETGDRLFEQYAPGAGMGLRLLLNKRSRTNLCVDYGWGRDGSHGLYLAIQDAF